ncbi:alpha-tubulin N-acetyltransferase-like isoform X3 [Scylla paramamosain]|uniref:alpha-tubulin N-acetyltransferase-like isoform X3 n=1 Tax=Scylla paramamosain TaxID=85552 RepID=UPI00308277A4
MEFRFDVGHILQDEITLVDNNLIVKNWKSSTRNRVEYQQLYEIINAIGEASSFAQGLNNIITTSEKLQNSDHLLYLMKEDDESIGVTLVVGMLKVGRKKLFLLDPNQRTKEAAPLCVLDFYIHESRQRRGYGRRLFDYMLRDQNVTPEYMAVDKPSDKFLGFLHKHYNLYKQVPQINNFVVFEPFFMAERPIVSEEAALIQVSRSPRAASPEHPTQSPSGSRRSSTSSNYSHSAGLPSRQANSMADILHGRPDRHTPAARLCPRYQTTLEWMRGPSSGSETPYSRASNSYSASRTPSNTGSPLRTPWGGSPPRTQPHTPPTTSQPASRKKSADLVDGHSSPEGSIAPTPATSPERSPIKEPQKNGEGEDGVIRQQPPPEEDGVVESVAQMSLSAGPQSPARSPELCGLMNLCKNSQWRDSVARSSAALAERMSSPTGSTMSGVLHENDSVHGHLKFHHHALW